jgi:hypothetical protein
MIRPTEKECTHIQTVLFIRDNGKRTNNTDLELNIGQITQDMRGSTKMARNTG